MADKQSGKKEYRVVQNEGKISWRVEELWDGGVTRGPYGSKQAAINIEGNIARENGFIDDLVLLEVGEETTTPTESFEKDAKGNWRCLRGCSIEIDNKEIVFTEGLEFTKGTLFMGVDIAKWLEENT
ncbi:hypothetical protein ACFLTB_05185 [Chloroflexota bacterium]